MCCLFGLIDYGRVLNPSQKTKYISVLGKECEARGMDASGISYVRQGKLQVYKRPLPAHQMHFLIPKNSCAVMGHTRMTTQGTEKNNYNNHPFIGKLPDSSFSLAHNGVLLNDFDLKLAGSLPDTNIKTDSYVIVQLIEKQGTLNFSSLKLVSEMLIGSFTFTVLDIHNNLYFVKGDNPICIYHFRGFCIYASTEKILTAALGKLGLLHKPHKNINMSCGKMLKIAADGSMEKSHFNIMSSLYNRHHTEYSVPLQSYKWQKSFYDSDVNYQRKEDSQFNHSIYLNDAYEDELIRQAGHHGISNDEIYMLMDYGYDMNTIEEFIFKPKIIKECIEELSRSHRLYD